MNNIERRLSRRDFLKGAARVSVAVAGLLVLERLGMEAHPANAAKKSLPETLTNSTETFSNILVSREYLEQNPQDVRASTDILDSNGNVIKQYVLHSKRYAVDNIAHFDNYVSETHIENGKLTEPKKTSNEKLPLENVLSISSSSDGRVVVVGGEKAWLSGQTGVAISYDYGKTFKEVPWNYVTSGGVIDIKRITENIYYLNNGNYEAGINQCFLETDSNTQTASIRPASIEQIRPAGFQTAGSYDIRITSINNPSNTFRAFSVGSPNIKPGIDDVKVNYQTGQGTVENINEVTINGKPGLLHYLYGNGYYEEAGDSHIVASNHPGQVLVDTNINKKTAVLESYARLLDNKGIPGYMNGSVTISPVDVITDEQGKRHTWIGGGYSSSLDNSGHAAIINKETGIFYDLSPNKVTSIWQQKDMKIKKINGQTYYELIIRSAFGFGRAFLPINPDGSPIPNTVPLYVNSVGQSAEPLPTPTPSPTKTPESLNHKVHLPVVTKSYSGGW